MIIPDNYPITIIRGRAFDAEFELIGVNLTGKTVASQLRAKESQSSELIAHFTVTVTPAADSVVKIALTDDQTAVLVQEQGFYDILIVEDDATYVRGAATILGSVTNKAEIPT